MDALIMYVVGTIMHALPYYANYILSISYICISFLHATGLSILCIVFVYSPAGCWKLAEFGETLPREILLQVYPFFMFSL